MRNPFRRRPRPTAEPNHVSAMGPVADWMIFPNVTAPGYEFRDERECGTPDPRDFAPVFGQARYDTKPYTTDRS